MWLIMVTTTILLIHIVSLQYYLKQVHLKKNPHDFPLDTVI